MIDVRAERVADAMCRANNGHSLVDQTPELADYFRTLAQTAIDVLDADDAPPAPDEWEPDQNMAAAVLSAPKASRGMTDLPQADRSWLVAGLGKAGLGDEAGLTAKDIAERLNCSLRLVRAIRAEPGTQICEWWLRRSRAQDDELRLEHCAHQLTRNLLVESRRAADRLRIQVDQLLDAHMSGTLELFHCGHPRLDWNIYECQVNDRGRKRIRKFCRQCGSGRSVDYQKRHPRKASDQRKRANHSGGVSIPHLRSVASGS